MRVCLIFACISLLAPLGISLADDTPHGQRQETHDLPAVEAILREASELTLKQDQRHNFWTGRVLLGIGETQIRCGDFDGALRTIRPSSYWYGRNSYLV
jgi:hypothetical protein